MIVTCRSRKHRTARRAPSRPARTRTGPAGTGRTSRRNGASSEGSPGEGRARLAVGRDMATPRRAGWIIHDLARDAPGISPQRAARRRSSSADNACTSACARASGSSASPDAAADCPDSGDRLVAQARLHAFVGVVDVHVEHQLVAAMPGGEPFHGAAVLVRPWPSSISSGLPGFASSKPAWVSRRPRLGCGCGRCAAAGRSTLLQHGVQRRVLQRCAALSRAAGRRAARCAHRPAACRRRGAGAPGAAAGGAEERGDLGRRVGRLQAQHAGLQRHAALRQLLMKAGGALHQPAMLLRHRDHGRASVSRRIRPSAASEASACRTTLRATP